MTVKIRVARGVLTYDINTMGPAGPLRERRNVPAAIRTEKAAQRWAEARERHLTINGEDVAEKVPAQTLAEFGPRWMRDYCKAEGLKPSTLDAYERILRLHLYPAIGGVRLDSIRELEIQRVKLRAAGKSDKTRACILSLLAELLDAAERWEEIAKAPKIELPSYMTAKMEFYDFSEWERLVDGARRAGPMQLAMILLAGEAGLRRGELVALEQADIGPKLIEVRRSEWHGKIGKPKGGRERSIPMTSRLHEAIAAVRHLRGKRLLWQAHGKRVGITTLQSWMEVATRRAGLPESRNMHRLRHTFCSHLALRGVPAVVIQKLAGHADLKTTMRYMHLAGGSLEDGIAMLERGAGVEHNIKTKGR